MIVLKESKYTYLYQGFRRNRKYGAILLSTGMLVLIAGTFLRNWSAILYILGFLSVTSSYKFFASSRNYQKGIKGEKAVTETLQRLDDSYYLINDVMLEDRGGNIDHVLLCPKGIFVIETKNYSGDFLCQGDRWSKKGQRRFYRISSVTRQAKHNAENLHQMIRRETSLDAWVSPICVFTNHSVDLHLKSPNVPVLRLDQLVEFLLGTVTRVKLSGYQIQAISKCVLKGQKENHSLD